MVKEGISEKKCKSGSAKKNTHKECEYCHKTMRPDYLTKHIAAVHSAKATKEQLRKAQKSRRNRWFVCSQCGATMRKENKARHVRACTGHEEYLKDDTTGIGMTLKKGPKSIV